MKSPLRESENSFSGDFFLLKSEPFDFGVYRNKKHDLYKKEIPDFDTDSQFINFGLYVDEWRRFQRSECFQS